MPGYIKFEELSKKTNISFDELLYLVDHKILNVSHDENEPSFGDDSIQKVQSIEKLISIGYTLKDAGRIVKNIGQPQKEKNAKYSKVWKKNDLFTPGELAKLFNVSTRAIKYWEEKKLIRPYTRSRSGIRFYHKKTIIEIMLLKGFQDLGFSLDEIKVYLDLYHYVMEIQKIKIDQPEKARYFIKKLNELDFKLDGLEYSINSLKRLSKKGRERLDSITKQIRSKRK